MLCISSCRDKVICPAFQSTYILDDSVRSVYYSYLWKLDVAEREKYLAGLITPATVDPADSAALGGPVIASTAQTDYFAYLEPYKVREREVKKNKYGMVKYEPYWLTNYQQKTAPMENVLAPPPPPVIEPVDTVKDVGQFVASDFSDSLTMDSTAVVANMEADTLGYDSLDIPSFPSIVQAPPQKPKLETQYLYKYDPKDKELNVEQAYYNKYFGQYLYRRVPVMEEPPASENPEAENEGGGVFAFFKGLFDKKEVKSDSVSVKVKPPIVETEEPPVQEELETEDDGF
ncbi:MAG: hypothetical protein RIC35_07485 [Marinoscillum sp.]